MYTIKNNKEYTNLISNLNFINNNLINNYYNEMNSHKWIIKNDSPDKFNLYLDYFNNNVNNFQDNQETIFQEQQHKFCNHINKRLGKPTRIKMIN